MKKLIAKTDLNWIHSIWSQAGYLQGIPFLYSLFVSINKIEQIR